MKYRKLGRCNGLKVSEIALGCEGFIGKTQAEFKGMLDKALELGINFIDMYTPNPEFRDNLGIALEGRRKKWCCKGISARYGKTGSICGPGIWKRRRLHLKTS